MLQTRVIPCLLLSGSGLVKTRNYKDAVYVGDPVNAVRIFSDKEANEIIILDINASRLGHEPNYELIAEIAGEAFMPVAYGGGIQSLTQIRRLIRLGVEKVVINTAATESTEVIRQAADVFGSQSIVGGIDIRRKFFGEYVVVAKSATIKTTLNYQQHIANLVEAGVGEIFVNNVDKDGAMNGFDLNLIRAVANAPVPVVVCGGAGNLDHLREAIHEGGASAVAAGSMFIFHGKNRAVLISYPKANEIDF
jgi:cyclase